VAVLAHDDAVHHHGAHADGLGDQAIGAGRQVMVVTHRAEIASRAATHLVVERGDLDGRARASVRAVDGEERVAEVARLMSGRQTAAALARARELLEEGGLRSLRRAAATIGPG